VRTPQQNVYVSAALDNKSFLNYASGSAVSDYASRAVSLSLYGNRFDDLAGGGSTSGNLTLTQGHLALDSYDNHAADASTLQTAGNFRKLRYGLSRQQFVRSDLILLASWSGQWTDQNLDSSEKFALGGSTGVRAYPGGEGSGAIGQLLSTELRWRWSEALALSAFYDTGNVTINARNDYVGASALNAYSLSGGGLALAWQWNNRASAKLTWARRSGSNPNPSATGNDQDGTLLQDRLWASASFAF
jgi:hemolysin activation/secretion protein